MTHELHERSEKRRLQKELKANLETTQQILDMMDDALVIVEDGKIVRTNHSFLELAEAENIEAFNEAGGRIDKLFLPAKGYIGHCSNKELLEKLQNEPLQKAMVKDSGGARVMLLRQKPLGEKSQIVMLTDVTTMEKDLLTHHQKLLTNPFTGIPNKQAFVDKLTDTVEKGACSVVLAVVSEYEKLIKWHGKESAIEVEKLISSAVKSYLAHKGLSKSVYFANYDKNRFALIAYPKTALMVSDDIAELELSYSYHRSEKDAEVHTVPVRLQTKTVQCAQEASIKELITTIEQAFDKLSMV